LSFFFNAHNNFLEEIAKFRAARRMWAKIMRTRFHALKKRSMQLRFHTQVAGSTLAAQQIDNNVVRVAVQALAAVMGGTQSLHTNGRDEALSLPTEASATLALRTQQVIAHETGVADFVDPMGGSFVIEQLTDELEAEAERLIGEIDSVGGMVSAIEQGIPQRAIQAAAYSTQRDIERGDQVVVGVNSFLEKGEEAEPEVLKVDSKREEVQVASLRAMKETRDERMVADALDAIQQAASGSENLMPPILNAAREQVTIGEIATSMREVFGVYKERIVV
jgi:methylmalonyl-CoA mutase N-terminal domain/subunit